MKFIKLLSFIFLLQTGNLFAQSFELKETELNADNKIAFCKPVSNLIAEPGNEKKILQKICEPYTSLETKLMYTVKENNNIHNYYQFVFKGIPIVGADYVVHSTKGVIQFANGNIPVLNPNSQNTKPALGYKEAETLLNQQLISENESSPKVSFQYLDKGLVWLFINKTTSLAYMIETKGTGILLAGNYFIDANTGDKLAYSSFICSFMKNDAPPPNAPGTAQTLYSGTQSITTDVITGGYRLRENRNNVNILTLNANYGSNMETLVTTATDFFDNNNIWQTTEHVADVQAHDVHWATEKVLDYFRIQHNRNSLDNNGMQARSFVHFNGTSGPVDNAYYYAGVFNAGATHSMYYGDGNVYCNPLVSLDVVGHEMGHGIDEYSSQYCRNLFNEGEAVNEALSDIWSATIEHWAAPAKQPWLIGEEIMKNGFSCLRSLRNPKTEGFRPGFSTEGNYPDTYLRTYYDVTNNDAHRNATVLGHWYYLLVVGGSGTNDIGNAFTVNGIGFDKAAAILYKTQTTYLNLNAYFTMVRTMSIQATRDLYGINSCEEREITNAWYAVGIGAAYNATLPHPNLAITGAQTFCNSIICTLNNVPCGMTATWTATPAGIVNFSCQNCNQTTVTKITSGNVTISAKITNPNGTSQTVSSPVIHAGIYTSADYTLSGNNGSPYWCPNKTITFQVSGPSTSNVLWTLPTAWSMVYNGGYYIAIKPPSSPYPPTGTLSVNFTEPCGTTITKSTFLAYSSTACTSNNPCYTYSPNPAPSYINVNVISSCIGTTYIRKIELVSGTSGASVYFQDYSYGNVTSTTVPVSGLPAGSYYLRIYDGTNWSSYSIMH